MPLRLGGTGVHSLSAMRGPAAIASFSTMIEKLKSFADAAAPTPRSILYGRLLQSFISDDDSTIKIAVNNHMHSYNASVQDEDRIDLDVPIGARKQSELSKAVAKKRAAKIQELAKQVDVKRALHDGDKGGQVHKTRKALALVIAR